MWDTSSTGQTLLLAIINNSQHQWNKWNIDWRQTNALLFGIIKYTTLCLHNFPLWKLSSTTHLHIHEQFTITSIEAVIDRIIRVAEWINSIITTCVKPIHLIKAGGTQRALTEACVWTHCGQHFSKRLQDPIKLRGIFGAMARWRIIIIQQQQKLTSSLTSLSLCVCVCADSVK